MSKSMRDILEFLYCKANADGVNEDYKLRERVDQAEAEILARVPSVEALRKAVCNGCYNKDVCSKKEEVCQFYESGVVRIHTLITKSLKGEDNG